MAASACSDVMNAALMCETTKASHDLEAPWAVSVAAVRVSDQQTPSDRNLWLAEAQTGT